MTLKLSSTNRQAFMCSGDCAKWLVTLVHFDLIPFPWHSQRVLSLALSNPFSLFGFLVRWLIKAKSIEPLRPLRPYLSVLAALL